MTSDLYRAAFEKARLVRHEPLNDAGVRAVFDAHLLHVRHVESHVNLLQEQLSGQGEGVLRSYQLQQDMPHMKTSESVEDYYRTALSQPEASFQIFVTTTVALESRQINFEMQKELLQAALKKSVPSTPRGPLRIVKLLFEGTSIQHELKNLVRKMTLQNPVQFVGDGEDQFLQKVCSVPWSTNSTATEKV